MNACIRLGPFSTMILNYLDGISSTLQWLLDSRAFQIIKMDFSVKQIHLRIIQKNSVLNEYHFHRPSCNNIPKNWGRLPTQNRTTEKHNNNNNVVLTRRQKSYLDAYENEKIQEYKLVYFTKIDELLYLQTFFMRKKHTYTSNFFLSQAPKMYLYRLERRGGSSKTAAAIGAIPLFCSEFGLI